MCFLRCSSFSARDPWQVRLWCDCPFWPNDGLCHLRDCAVCECPPEEVPLALRDTGGGRLSEDHPQCQEGRPHAAVDRTLETQVFHTWSEIDSPWTRDNEGDGGEGDTCLPGSSPGGQLCSSREHLSVFCSFLWRAGEMSYVNLLLNPERYTGYKGQSARRIWQAIYMEGCFKGVHSHSSHASGDQSGGSVQSFAAHHLDCMCRLGILGRHSQPPAKCHTNSLLLLLFHHSSH